MTFTVKHRAADGTETIHSCETVTVRGGPSYPHERDMYSEGIYLDPGVEYPMLEGELTDVATAKHIIQFGGDETDDRKARKGGKVWVMNEAGATVATYDL